MPHRVPALVKPELLIWARQSAGFSSLDQVAELSGFDAVTLLEWEQGHDLPSLGQLRKLGEVYKRPLAVFFLAEPPRTFRALRIPALRSRRAAKDEQRAGSMKREASGRAPTDLTRIT